jgi:hypothetical protein
MLHREWMVEIVLFFNASIFDITKKILWVMLIGIPEALVKDTKKR